MTLRSMNEMWREIRIWIESFNTLHDIARVYIEGLISNNYLFMFESWSSARQLSVDNLIEFMGVSIGKP